MEKLNKKCKKIVNRIKRIDPETLECIGTAAVLFIATGVMVKLYGENCSYKTANACLVHIIEELESKK